MSKLDSFSAQLVTMVRQMPDEALLELIRQQLAPADAPSEPLAEPPVATPTKQIAKGRAKARKAATKKAAPSRPESDRKDFAAAVEQLIKASDGVALADIAQSMSEPKARVASVVRQLKKAGRIQQGGDRRFARYAGSLKKAQAASMRARKGE